MDNEFYVEESNPRNVKITILIIILIIGLFIGGFYYLRYNSGIKLKKNIVYSIGSEVSTNPLDYIKSKNISEEEIDLDISDIPLTDNKASKIGEYSFTIYYNNKPKKGVVKIIDKKAPIVEVSPITVGEGEDFELDDLITKCEEDSKPCEVSLKNESDYDKFKSAGEYVVPLIVKDLAGNKTNIDAKVIVKKGYSRENLKKSDLNIDHMETVYDDWNKQMLLKFDEAVHPDKFDSDPKYELLLDLSSEDLSIYLPSEYSGNAIVDTQMIGIYNKYDYIIGFAFRVKLDNEKYIYLTR